ncbi:hypothetical protein EDB92DRAFT_1844194 [Lactarius akahatsu]|uniref:Secreted protein n=1 Tax=Lactarius akahatsu TaxID=416441 RepID=A0AAD4LMF8_9AGAM|nr:hypothetical protein EDB92DRAFT_1844194 [Lactarius akahatsu]
MTTGMRLALEIALFFARFIIAIASPPMDSDRQLSRPLAPLPFLSFYLLSQYVPKKTAKTQTNERLCILSK